MAEETKEGLLDFLINAASLGLAKAKNEAKEEELIEETEDEEEVKNCGKKAKNEDKRKLIDEIAGMMKSAGCDDELIRTAIGKMEKLGYDKSEAKTADNEDEEKEGKKEAKKELKNEDKEEKEQKYKEFKEEIEKATAEKAENKDKKAKNSIEDLKASFYDGEVKNQPKYMTQKDGIELGKKLY